MNRRGFLGTLIAAAIGRKLVPKTVTRWSNHTAKPLGMTIRVIRTYSRDTDKYENRLDMLYGMTVVKPEYACRLVDGEEWEAA